MTDAEKKFAAQFPVTPPSVRRVIQIVAFPHNGTMDRIAALCDDGTMWRAHMRGYGYPMDWDQIDSIPQTPTRR